MIMPSNSKCDDFKNELYLMIKKVQEDDVAVTLIKKIIDAVETYENKKIFLMFGILCLVISYILFILEFIFRDYDWEIFLTAVVVAVPGFYLFVAYSYTSLIGCALSKEEWKYIDAVICEQTLKEIKYDRTVKEVGDSLFVFDENKEIEEVHDASDKVYRKILENGGYESYIEYKSINRNSPAMEENKEYYGIYFNEENS